MSSHAELGRISWLSAALSTQRHRIMKLLGRISDLGMMQAMKPALFHKFLNLMGQVAVAKDEEVRLLSAIEAIEQKHRFRRKQGKLFHPKARRVPGNLELNAYAQDGLGHIKVSQIEDFDNDTYTLEEIEEYEAYCEKYQLYGESSSNKAPWNKGLSFPDIAFVPERPRHGWLWLLAIWYFMTTRGNSKGNQKLNPD